MLSESMEQWTKEFRAKGREEGRKEGMQIGQAALLSFQLSRRFGSLPTWVDERLSAASAAERSSWSVAVLDAASLDEVFARPPARH